MSHDINTIGAVLTELLSASFWTDSLLFYQGTLVMLEVFLERIPTFELADPEGVTWTGGQVRGPRTVPIRF